jgi:hypothetical protein
MKKRLLLFIGLVCSITTLTSQNLLNTSNWTIGSGSVSGFAKNGLTSENSREFGTDPFGNSSILWKGGNDAASNEDGNGNVQDLMLGPPYESMIPLSSYLNTHPDSIIVEETNIDLEYVIAVDW